MAAGISENAVQTAVVGYLRKYLPAADIIVNPYAGMLMTKKQAARAKTLGLQAGQCDLIVMLQTNDGFAGLCLELKADGVSIFKKNGTVRKNAHLQAQYEYLELRKSQGFAAYFAVGFAEAKRLIQKHYAL